MIEQFAHYLVDLVFTWGYVGIFLLMAVESSFVPFPSEIVLIPAGYLAFSGKMDISYILLSGVLGSLVGALINYYLAFFMGRKFLEKYGNYFFISQETLKKMDNYFKNHGHISTFSGRLVPGVRQLISIPAGLAKMNMVEFLVFTFIGAGIWAGILVALGYFLGQNQALISEYLHQLTLGAVGFVTVLGGVYYLYYKRKK